MNKKKLLTIGGISVASIVILSAITFVVVSNFNKPEKQIAATVKPPAVKQETKYYAPYTGEEVTKDVLDKVAFMTTIENNTDAWPLSGVNSADIVYEFMTEGGITRFFALYQSKDTAKIGPVRSVRTYFLDLVHEYNLPFGHCGGSHDATPRIPAENLMDLDQMFNDSSYWRDPAIKVQEHGLYTSTDKLRALATQKGYVKSPTVKLNFDDKFWTASGLKPATTINIKFNLTYNSSYIYKDGLYYKSMNGKEFLNKEDSKPVTVRNIVYQIATYKSRANEPYLDCNLIGEGDGYIFSNGNAKAIKWSRANLNSQTIIKDENGKIVPLSPGNTWWHVADPSTNLTFN